VSPEEVNSFVDHEVVRPDEAVACFAELGLPNPATRRSPPDLACIST
jgi:hypothetical protein